ncbi:15173_t:CDS:2 [Funneliformis mosseae]|uniref:15173_t:CDS:1 n=1 Tax=Funneliformis mosseae TaxID=27381 RepID=A0A9N9CIK7_FUNMO|nr:15173_t:CDS:2 [Funneliformis mosseae]
MNVTKIENKSVQNSPLEEHFILDVQGIKDFQDSILKQGYIQDFPDEQGYKEFVERTSKYQIDENNYYTPNDDDIIDTEESKALLIKLNLCKLMINFDSIKIARLTVQFHSNIQVSIKRWYKDSGKFPDPKRMFNLKARGLTTPEKFVSWWNENHPDCLITVNCIEKWTYREDEDLPDIMFAGENMGTRLF